MSLDPWLSYRAGTWLTDECQIVVIVNVTCLTVNNLSGVLDTTDTSLMQPCSQDTF